MSRNSSRSRIAVSRLTVACAAGAGALRATPQSEGSS